MLESLYKLIESRKFHKFIALIIFINAAILAIQTYYTKGSTVFNLIRIIDNLILVLFTIEVSIRFSYQGKNFWNDPWNIFDFSIVSLGILPSLIGIPSLVPLRILRLFHIVYELPKLRKVVVSLFSSIPYIGSIFVVLFLIVFVYSIIGINQYGERFPEYFGDLHTAFLTMFTLITLENWTDILSTFMEVYSYSWIFILSFIVVATFIIFNLFIGVIVDSMSKNAEEGMEASDEMLIKLRKDVSEIKNILKSK